MPKRTFQPNNRRRAKNSRFSHPHEDRRWARRAGPPPCAGPPQTHRKRREIETNRFPKNARILRSSDFRKVYDGGTRFSGPLFAAFCLLEPDLPSPRIGFTVPRALGPAVTRNRIKRRFREAVRHRLDELISPWSIVINPRRSSLECPLLDLEREIQKLFARCSKRD